MNKDLQDFLKDVTWFFSEIDEIEVSGIGSFECSKEFEDKYPFLTLLLKKARITKIQYQNQNYELYGWTNKSLQSFGWLCLGCNKEINIIEKPLHPDHILLLENFGGIIERWNEPENIWLNNLNNALTYEDAVIGFNGWEDVFKELCEMDGVEVKINPDDFISFAFEANGNLTMYHKESGKVLMYASDHLFDFVSTLDNYPEYTLYKINNCHTFRDWVETVAIQWLKQIKY